MAGPVVSVVGLKGGVGKTSTAIALASWWGMHGSRVLVVDADVNGSATRWFGRGRGELPFRCVPIQQAPMVIQKGDVDLIVTDTAGGSRDEAVAYAEGSNLVVCPAQPSASSLEQLLDLVDLIRPTGTEFVALLTLVDSRRRGDADRARKLLENQGIPVLEQQLTLLSCWPQAEAAGCIVADARNDQGRPSASAARGWDEIGAMADAVTLLVDRPPPKA
jgi:chromosome partitioning protein